MIKGLGLGIHKQYMIKYRPLAVGVVMTCHGRHVGVHKYIVAIERKCFSHGCARTQAATLT